MPVVITVSCDATTFARDAKILIEGGYKLDSVTPVDQFRYSHHVEIVAKFDEVALRLPKIDAAAPALLPHLFADRAGNAGRLRQGRNDPPFRLSPGNLEHQFRSRCFDEFSRSRIGTTKAPGPPMTQSS